MGAATAFAEDSQQDLDTSVNGRFGQEFLLEPRRDLEDVSDDVRQRPQLDRAGIEQLLEVGIDPLPPGESPSELLDEQVLSGPLRALRRNVLDDFRGGDPIPLFGRQLGTDADSFETDQQQVEPAVEQSLVADDFSETTHAFDRVWLRLGSPRAARLDLDHRDQIVRRQGVLGHLTIARLEDVERQDRVREEDEPGEREQPIGFGEALRTLMIIQGDTRKWFDDGAGGDRRPWRERYYSVDLESRQPLRDSG